MKKWVEDFLFSYTFNRKGIRTGYLLYQKWSTKGSGFGPQGRASPYKTLSSSSPPLPHPPPHLPSLPRYTGHNENLMKLVLGWDCSCFHCHFKITVGQILFQNNSNSLASLLPDAREAAASGEHLSLKVHTTITCAQALVSFRLVNDKNSVRKKKRK